MTGHHNVSPVVSPESSPRTGPTGSPTAVSPMGSPISPLFGHLRINTDGLDDSSRRSSDSASTIRAPIPIFHRAATSVQHANTANDHPNWALQHNTDYASLVEYLNNEENQLSNDYGTENKECYILRHPVNTDQARKDIKDLGISFDIMHGLHAGDHEPWLVVKRMYLHFGKFQPAIIHIHLRKQDYGPIDLNSNPEYHFCHIFVEAQLNNVAHFNASHAIPNLYDPKNMCSNPFAAAYSVGWEKDSEKFVKRSVSFNTADPVQRFDHYIAHDLVGRLATAPGRILLNWALTRFVRALGEKTTPFSHSKNPLLKQVNAEDKRAHMYGMQKLVSPAQLNAFETAYIKQKGIHGVHEDRLEEQHQLALEEKFHFTPGDDTVWPKWNAEKAKEERLAAASSLSTVA